MKNARTCGWRARETGAKSGGFTLIELLTVISIIGLVAGLVIGVGPVAAKKMRISRTTSDLRQLETAIENYKAKFGNYPPDNQTPLPPVQVQGTPVTSQSHYGFPNQLFYELTGCVYNNNAGTFQSLNNNANVVTTNDLKSILTTDGIQNSSENSKEVQNYFKEIKPSQVGYLVLPGKKTNLNFFCLTAPFPAPKNAGFDPLQPNYWYYVSKNPTNNTQTFDLWTVIDAGGVATIIKNW